VGAVRCCGFCLGVGNAGGRWAEKGSASFVRYQDGEWFRLGNQENLPFSWHIRQNIELLGNNTF